MINLLEKAKIGEIYKIKRDDADGLTVTFKNGKQSRIPNGEIVLLLEIKVGGNIYGDNPIELTLLYDGMICVRHTRLWFDEIFEMIKYEE